MAEWRSGGVRVLNLGEVGESNGEEYSHIIWLMKRLIIALMGIVLSLAVEAKESQFVVRAFVREASEAKWTPVNDVHVSLRHGDTGEPVSFKLLTGNDTTKVADNGSGEIRLLVNGGRGQYLLTLDAEGYEPLMKEFELKYKSQSVISLPQLSMIKERSLALKEVEVIGTAVKLVVKGDTLVYNANALNLAEGSMLDALIKQLDGVELDADGNITVNGRAVSSLLINGKDFFKGDPLVALENLPAYTVNNVKVYDKAAEDDYLTQSSSKLARREDEENLVMDVVLKKEYNLGYMGSVEGGYGTDNRWLGKVFGLGFSDKWRLSAFYNTNNLGDTQRAGANGWRNNAASTGGENTVHTTGLDYMYDHKKLKINGNITYLHQDRENLSEVNSTRYYNTGDLFRQSYSKSNALSNQLRTSHELKQKWDEVYFGADLKFNYNSNRNKSLQREATFTSQPDENSRIEALDSVFARPFSKRYNDILLSRISTNSLTNPGNLSFTGELEATVRTSNMQGRINLEAGGGYNRSWSDTRTIYLQHFGGANTSGGTPVKSDRFTPDHSNSYNVKANATYIRDWSSISGEKWQNRVNLRTRLAFTRNESDKEYNLFNAEGREDVLPSLQTPENAIRDLQDSHNSSHMLNNGDARVQVNFNREPLAPSATGINPSFGFSAAVTYMLRNENLNYHIAEYSNPEILTRTKHHVATNLNANFSSGNDLRYWTVNASYSMTSADPSINLFLRTRSNSNPMFIYENNAGNLRPSRTNSVSLRFNRFGRKIHNTLFGNLSWSKTDNTVGQWSQYDPQTGITTARPMNINGNWNTNGNVSYSHPLGNREQVLLSGSVNAAYNHSVDFQSTTSAPVRSLVRNTNLGGSLQATYKFKNGSNISISGGPTWQYATSDRERFNTVDAMNYHATVSGVAELPWDVQFRTNLDMIARRGYQEAAMNTTQWLWNASVTKSILNGNLIFKIIAVDILGQIDPVRLTVNAQGRTEAWYNTLPRYGMLTVTWRFNRTPSKMSKMAPRQRGAGRGPGSGRHGGAGASPVPLHRQMSM